MLKYARDQMDAQTIVTSEADIRQLDQVIQYLSRVLSTLPTPPQECLKTLHEGLTTNDHGPVTWRAPSPHAELAAWHLLVGQVGACVPQ